MAEYCNCWFLLERTEYIFCKDEDGLLYGYKIREWIGDGLKPDLLLFMAVDWFTGGILLPAVFGKSPKSEKGTLESRAGWKGLCRKAMTLFYVLIAARLDALMGTDYLRDAVCIGFIANEALSIIENAGLMGLPLPERLKKSIDVLKAKADSSME